MRKSPGFVDVRWELSRAGSIAHELALDSCLVSNGHRNSGRTRQPKQSSRIRRAVSALMATSCGHRYVLLKLKFSGLPYAAPARCGGNPHTPRVSEPSPGRHPAPLSHFMVVCHGAARSDLFQVVRNFDDQRSVRQWFALRRWCGQLITRRIRLQAHP